MLLKKGVEFLPGFMCRLLCEKSLPQVNELIASNFTHQLPGRQVFKITKEDIGDYDIRAAEEHLKCNASLGTFVKETGELIAVELNTIHNKTEGDTLYTIETSEKNALEVIFLKSVLGDVFSDLNTNRYMYLSMGCTKSTYRSKGIFSALEDWRVHLARARGCEYIVSVAGSLYSQRYTKSKGYKVLREKAFTDFIDPKTGVKPDLEPSPIHTSYQMVYKKTPYADEKPF